MRLFICLSCQSFSFNFRSVKIKSRAHLKTLKTVHKTDNHSHVSSASSTKTVFQAHAAIQKRGFEACLSPPPCKPQE